MSPNIDFGSFYSRGLQRVTNATSPLHFVLLCCETKGYFLSICPEPGPSAGPCGRDKATERLKRGNIMSKCLINLILLVLLLIYTHITRCGTQTCPLSWQTPSRYLRSSLRTGRSPTSRNFPQLWPPPTCTPNLTCQGTS